MTETKRPLPEHSDFHKTGAFAVVSPDGQTDFGTFESTAHGARAAYLRHANRRWSVAEEQGYEIHEFVAVARVVRQDAQDASSDILPGVPTTAQGWQLYDQPASEEIALTIAREFSKLLREEALTLLALDEESRQAAANRVTYHMEKLMCTFRHAGAYDTEPRIILRELVQKAFRPA